MKKLLFALFFLFISGCRFGFGFNTEINPEINIEPNVNPEISVTYLILTETVVYSSFSIDSDQVTVLPVGTEVVPADGNTSLDCKSFTNEGAAYSICKIEVVGSDVTGWILEDSINK